MKKAGAQANVRRIKHVRNCGVLIETANAREALKIKTVVDNAQCIKFREPRTKFPKIIVYNMPKHQAEDAALQEIHHRNLAPRISEDTFKTETKLLFKLRTRGETDHWVLETQPETFQAIMELGRLFLGFGSHKTEIFKTPSRCFNCQRFGHTTKHCEEKTETCGYCAQTKHGVKDCPIRRAHRRPTCANCVRRKAPEPTTRHEINSKTCPEYKRAQEHELRSTTFTHGS